jgi:hypothetical protein
LLLIACALAIRYLSKLRGRTAIRPRHVLPALALIWILLGLFSGMSEWRHGRITGDAVSLNHALAAGMSEPLTGINQAGLDTLDGLLLVPQVERDRVDASPVRLHSAFTQLIPSQLWQSKGTFVSEDVGRDYLGYGASGMFLSGLGYLQLIMGNRFAAIIALAGIAAAVELVILSARRSIWQALAFYFWVRFFFGGDAFDLFHVIALSIVVGAYVALAGVVLPARRRSQGRSDEAARVPVPTA